MQMFITTNPICNCSNDYKFALHQSEGNMKSLHLSTELVDFLQMLLMDQGGQILRVDGYYDTNGTYLTTLNIILVHHPSVPGWQLEVRDDRLTVG